MMFEDVWPDRSMFENVWECLRMFETDFYGWEFVVAVKKLELSYFLKI